MMSNFRRSWSEVGKRASLDQKQGFVNSYLYSAIAPIAGETFHLLGFSDMNGDTEYAFLKALKTEHPNQHVVLVLDNAPCHRPKTLHKIEGLTLIYLPSYSPELNPVERFFEELRRTTCNQIFESIAKIEERITNKLNSFTNSEIKQLCGYEWIREQCGVVK